MISPIRFGSFINWFAEFVRVSSRSTLFAAYLSHSLFHELSAAAVPLLAAYILSFICFIDQFAWKNAIFPGIDVKFSLGGFLGKLFSKV